MGGDRLVNDHCFECNALATQKVESFFGYYEGHESDGIDMLILKLKENDMYQRFFLDAGLGFWEEWDKEGTFLDYEDLKPVDLAAKYNLEGKEVISISCLGSFNELSSFIFEIGKEKLKLSYIEPESLDSDTILTRL